MLFKRISMRIILGLMGSVLLTGCASTTADIDKTAATKTSNSAQPWNGPTLDVARYGHAAAADNENIYVFGGANKDGFLSSIEIIDPKTNQATLLEDKIIPRRYFTAVWDGKQSIYLFGGISLRNGKVRQEPTV
ncbi:hypothetical protein CWI84_01275 [Idiomarina tyrosinivorans]|uniref:Galactose oxidase n=1 Tax=Idiomarina tyrosinivorans TaxID=1445662 RepID=A0A432ZUD0_9GAMM|nr:kelch repeat-containing protein [Idiomarina tyrosinivorans]RUO81418.1 hypothetical protein CWI84_01275 [Idiomarina tyrosinivorans]